MIEYSLRQEGSKRILNAQDSGGPTPLQLATLQNPEKEEKVRLLLPYGPDPEEEDIDRGRRILDCSVQGSEYLARMSLEGAPEPESEGCTLRLNETVVFFSARYSGHVKYRVI